MTWEVDGQKQKDKNFIIETVATDSDEANQPDAMSKM